MTSAPHECPRCENRGRLPANTDRLDGAALRSGRRRQAQISRPQSSVGGTRLTDTRDRTTASGTASTRRSALSLRLQPSDIVALDGTWAEVVAVAERATRCAALTASVRELSGKQLHQQAVVPVPSADRSYWRITPTVWKPTLW